MSRITIALLTVLVGACEDTSPLPGPVDFVGRDAGKAATSAKPRDAGAKDVKDDPSNEADEAEVEDEASGEDEASDEDEAEGDADDTSATAAPSADAGAPKDAGPRSDAAAPAGETASCDALTYESFGKKFVTTYCVECHSGTSASSALGGVSLDSLANIQKNKMYLKKVTAPRPDGKEPRMPKGDNPGLTNEERLKFGAWVDCGPE